MQFISRNIFIILGVMCLVAVGIIYIAMQRSQPEVVRNPGVLLYEAGHGIVAEADVVPPANPSPAPPPHDEPAYKTIHIVGAVYNPGVFTLRAGSRVVDAVEAAGGASGYADLVRINLAVVLQDAMQIIVPQIGQDIDEVFVFAEPTAAVGGATNGGLININTADATQLQTLPGIGPAISQNIIDFRETHGRFASVDELIHVNRIGPVILERLRELVTVD